MSLLADGINYIRQLLLMYDNLESMLGNIDKEEPLLSLNYKHILAGVELPDRASGIYFLQNINGYIKIGESGNIQQRIRTYGTHSPMPVWVCGYIPTSQHSKNEKFQHEIWAVFRVVKEWFAPCAPLVSYLTSFKGGAGVSLELMVPPPTNYDELIATQREETREWIESFISSLGGVAA